MRCFNHVGVDGEGDEMKRGVYLGESESHPCKIAHERAFESTSSAKERYSAIRIYLSGIYELYIPDIFAES